MEELDPQCFRAKRRLAILKTILAFAIVGFFLLSRADDQKPPASAVVVKILREALPHEENKRQEYLWDNFANKPDEQQFDSYGADNWKDNFSVFGKALVQKAADKKLDSASLQKALDLVLKDAGDKIAYLPVGAYQTTLDSEPIWIITVKWEYPRMGKKSGLGHIRMFAFNQKTLDKVGFVTCD